MPELPEVETIKNILAPQIKGLIIEEAVIRQPRIIEYPEAEKFRLLTEGRMVSAMSRRGKFLTIFLDSEIRIIMHLRMTGCLLLTPPDFPEEKHTHLIFRFNNKRELRFSDTRRFGRFWALEAGEPDTCTGITKLGPEPFDEMFTSEYLEANLKKRRKAIKGCLLDSKYNRRYRQYLC